MNIIFFQFKMELRGGTRENRTFFAARMTAARPPRSLPLSLALSSIPTYGLPSFLCPRPSFSLFPSSPPFLISLLPLVRHVIDPIFLLCPVQIHGGSQQSTYSRRQACSLKRRSSTAKNHQADLQSLAYSSCEYTTYY